jgi:biotin synthase
MKTTDILQKVKDGEILNPEDLITLLSLSPDSPDTYAVLAEAYHMSQTLSHRKAEIHTQFALNLAPCPCNCMFCSFAMANQIFDSQSELSPEEAVAYARQFEKNGANAIFIMTTATYNFDRYLEISQEIKRMLRPETVMIANVGDQTLQQANRLANSGFKGVYHALRLREGIDTTLSPEERKKSIRNFQEAGLSVGTCVEPIGPEHSPEELAEMILFTASIKPAYSGAARRIAIPGTELAQRGMITEQRMAQIVAITRLGMPRDVLGNCTHEPCTLGAIAGANVFWAEMGANPRDIQARTEEGRGDTVQHCATLFRESGWEILEAPSRFYGLSKQQTSTDTEKKLELTSYK